MKISHRQSTWILVILSLVTSLACLGVPAWIAVLLLFRFATPEELDIAGPVAQAGTAFACTVSAVGGVMFAVGMLDDIRELRHRDRNR